MIVHFYSFIVNYVRRIILRNTLIKIFENLKKYNINLYRVCSEQILFYLQPSMFIHVSYWFCKFKNKTILSSVLSLNCMFSERMYNNSRVYVLECIGSVAVIYIIIYYIIFLRSYIYCQVKLKLNFYKIRNTRRCLSLSIKCLHIRIYLFYFCNYFCVYFVIYVYAYIIKLLCDGHLTFFIAYRTYDRKLFIYNL